MERVEGFIGRVGDEAGGVGVHDVVGNVGMDGWESKGIRVGWSRHRCHTTLTFPKLCFLRPPRALLPLQKSR